MLNGVTHSDKILTEEFFQEFVGISNSEKLSKDWLTRSLDKIMDDFKDESLATALFSDTLDNDEKLRELKIFMKMQEQGLSIDYRCPACCSCQGCKNAPETKNILLPEEAEDQAIRESVSMILRRKRLPVFCR